MVTTLRLSVVILSRWPTHHYVLCFAEMPDGIRVIPGAHQVAYRLVAHIGYMHASELAGTRQAGEVFAVAPVGFDVIAGALRNERRRHHPAGVPERRDLAVNPEAARPRLVHEHELAPREVSFRTAFNSALRSPLTSPKRRTSPPCSATVISIESLCTSIPTKILLDCFMVRLRSKVDTNVPTLWLCVRFLKDGHVTHVTTEAGLPSFMRSHSV